jgi:amino acid transporter
MMLIGMAISMFGNVSGMTLAVPRMLFAFGRDGFLPSQLALVHPRWRTPYVAIVLQTVIVIAVAVSGTFERLAVVANGSVLLVYLACCAGVIQLRRRGVQENGAPFRVPFAAAVPVLAIAAIIWILTSLDVTAWKALLLVAVVAMIVYATSLPARRAAAAAA